ncbi:24116_t:CDS:1, partial [Dentiscutata erythropus]
MNTNLQKSCMQLVGLDSEIGEITQYELRNIQYQFANDKANNCKPTKKTAQEILD